MTMYSTTANRAEFGLSVSRALAVVEFEKTNSPDEPIAQVHIEMSADKEYPHFKIWALPGSMYYDCACPLVTVDGQENTWPLDTEGRRVVSIARGYAKDIVAAAKKSKAPYIVLHVDVPESALEKVIMKLDFGDNTLTIPATTFGPRLMDTSLILKQALDVYALRDGTVKTMQEAEHPKDMFPFVHTGATALLAKVFDKKDNVIRLTGHGCAFCGDVYITAPADGGYYPRRRFIITHMRVNLEFGFDPAYAV